MHIQRNDFAVLRFAGLWLVDPIKVGALKPFVISAAAAAVLGTARIPQPNVPFGPGQPPLP